MHDHSDDIFNDANVIVEATVIEEINPAVSFDQLKRMFRSAVGATEENDKLAARDRDYFDGEQLSPDVRRTLNMRGQPPIYTNKIAPAISGIFGIIDAGASDPQAHPRNANSNDAADVATKTLRFISDQCDFASVKRQVSETFIIQGIGAALIDATEDEVIVTRIRWEDFFYDPYSRETDFSDARFLGIAKWLDADQVEAMFPERYAECGDPFTVAFANDFKADLNEKRFWIDYDRKQLRVIEMYYLDAMHEWHRAIFCMNGLFYAGRSDYLDDRGRTVCPIVAESYEVNQRNDRYGAIRHMIPLQDEINARRSKLLHLTNHRQVQQTDLTASASGAIAVSEAAKADGQIPWGWSVMPAPDLAQGQMLILQQSMADLDRMAPTPAVLGRVSGSNESGRSRQILQQAGYTELARAIGRLERWEERCYRQMWFRARQFYTQPKWVRINGGDNRATQFLQINEPIVEPRIVPVVDPLTGQTLIDPMTGQPIAQQQMIEVGQRNRLAEIDVDIILSTVPDTVTLRQEVWSEMIQYAATAGISPMDPAFKILVQISPLPNKREITEEMDALIAKAKQEAQAEQAAQTQALAETQQIAAQLAADRERAKIAKDVASAAKSKADAERTNIESALITDSVMNQPYGQQMFGGYGPANDQPNTL